MKQMDEETRYAIRRGLEAHRSLTEIAKEIIPCVVAFAMMTLFVIIV